MPADDPNLRAWGELFTQLAPLIVGLGVLGVVVMVGLLIAWRRHQRRMADLDEAREQRAHAQPIEDVWALSAERTAPAPGSSPGNSPGNAPGAPDAPPPYTTRPPGAPEDDAYDEDDDDPDAHAPWRDSLPDLPDFDEDDEDDEDDPDDDDFDRPDDAPPSGGDWPRPPRKP